MRVRSGMMVRFFRWLSWLHGLITPSCPVFPRQNIQVIVDISSMMRDSNVSFVRQVSHGLSHMSTTQCLFYETRRAEWISIG
jgi:hypothetical protein